MISSSLLAKVTVYICSSSHLYEEIKECLLSHKAKIVTRINSNVDYVVVQSINDALLDSEMQFALTSGFWKHVKICTVSSVENVMIVGGLVESKEWKEEIEHQFSSVDDKKTNDDDMITPLEEQEIYSIKKDSSPTLFWKKYGGIYRMRNGNFTNEIMSEKDVKDLFVRNDLIGFESYEKALDCVQNIVFKNQDRIKLEMRKLVETSNERYQWFIGGYGENKIFENSHQNKMICTVYFLVEETVFYFKVFIDLEQDFKKVMESNKKEKDEDDMPPRTAEPKIPTRIFNAPNKKDFEQLGMQLDYYTHFETGLAILNNEIVFFKVNKIKKENIETMRRVERLSNEYLCKILKYTVFENCSDWCLTVVENLLNVSDVICLTETLEDRVDLCLESLSDILHGLKELHNNNIVHCDISLENIMFRKMENGQLRAVLIDFNNSLNLEKPNHEQFIKFKLAYSPKHGELTFVHDIYATALTFCRLVGEIVLQENVYFREEEFEVKCIEILERCKEAAVMKISPLIKEMIGCKYDSVEVLLQIIKNCKENN